MMKRRHCSATRDETSRGGRILEDWRKMKKMTSRNVIEDIKQGEFETTMMKMVEGLQDSNIMAESATIVERLVIMQEIAE